MKPFWLFAQGMRGNRSGAGPTQFSSPLAMRQATGWPRWARAGDGGARRWWRRTPGRYRVPNRTKSPFRSRAVAVAGKGVFLTEA